MLKQDVIAFYAGDQTEAEGIKRLAKALDVTRAAIYQWGETVPERQAWKLQALSGGRLTVDRRAYD